MSEPNEKKDDLVVDMTSAAWQDYVLTQFEPDELVEGLPKIGGLRRVARKLLGPIIRSESKVVEPVRFASYDPKLKEAGLMLSPVTIEHTTVIRWNRDDEGIKGVDVVFTAAADVYLGNSEENFVRFSTAVCGTRAEAITLRKALMLQKVIAFEERTTVPLSSAGVDGKITDMQIDFMRRMCKRNNINLEKFVNSGKLKYENLEEVPFDKASKMLEELDKLQNDQSKITAAIKGFDKNGSF
jgi:hypothetical protein